MNIAQRIDRYRGRGFQEDDAEIIVLIEEAVAGLFAAFPDHFIVIGGTTLLLFYESTRISRDLDLMPRDQDLPLIEDIARVIVTSVQPLTETLGGHRADRKDGRVRFLGPFLKGGSFRPDA